MTEPALTLYFWPTPNTRKVTIALAELALPYALVRVDIGKGEQFTRSFLAINPNNRVPALVDRATGAAVFESGAILVYLAEKAGRLLPTDAPGRARALSWLFWQVGGLGPALGQIGHFGHYANDRAYATARFGAEVDRLMGAMERGLEGHEHLAGDYSIADIACFPWVWSAPKIAGERVLDAFPLVRAWRDRVAARPAVLRGMRVGREWKREWSDDDRANLFGQTAASVRARSVT